MNQPAVSVVIPTYNYGRFVVSAVESVLSQTYKDFEIIVIDDGSKDDTGERLKPLQDRIRYIYQVNQGLSAARNRGIAEARGEFIALLDSDDQWHPRFLEAVMPEFERKPSFAMLGSGYITASECHWPIIDATTVGSTEIPVEALLGRHPLAPSAVVIRRSVLDRVGQFDTELRSVEDRDMWIRVGIAGIVGFVNAPLVWIRVHGSSMSSPSNAKRMEHFDRLVLQRAFENERLRNRWCLRREVLSNAAWTAAIGYREAGEFGQAWRCAAQALCLWPLPARKFGPLGAGFSRLRMLGCLVRDQLRAIRFSGSAQGPASGQSA